MVPILIQVNPAQTLSYIFKVFLLSLRNFSQCLPIAFHGQNSACICVHSHACFTPRPPYSPCSTYRLLHPYSPRSKHPLNLLSNTIKHCGFRLPPRSRRELRSRVVLISYRRFGTTCRSPSSSASLKMGTGRLSRNVHKESPVLVA